MKVLIAPDSFKGSISSIDAAAAMRRGVQTALPDSHIVELPIADGGEGTLEVLVAFTGGRFVECSVSGPLGDPVNARFGILSDNKTAVIEMASASGLTLVPPPLRNPRITTTYGTGELIRAALDEGVETIVIGLGGSGTNDGGAGMAEALGVRFLDDAGIALERGGAVLPMLSHIDLTGRDQRLSKVNFIAACDVQNMLCGEQGAAAVYGPQKGATPDDVELLDNALLHYSEVVKSSLGINIRTIMGGGAAGGLGAGLVAFCGARLRRGIDVVLDAVRFDEYLEDAHLVITGEGKIDTQLRFGKALAGVLERCRARHVPVVAVVGVMEGERSMFVNESSFDDLISLTGEGFTPDEAMLNASALIEQAAAKGMRRFLVRQSND